MMGGVLGIDGLEDIITITATIDVIITTMTTKARILDRA